MRPGSLRRIAGQFDRLAVMEKAERVAVVPVSMGWNDVGSWDALHAIGELDAAATRILAAQPVR